MFKNIERISIGQVGVKPGDVALFTDATLDEVTTAGFLNQTEGSVTLSPTDVIKTIYGADDQGVGTFEIFTVSISDGVVTLEQWMSPGDVVLPVVDGNFTIFDGTEGQLHDAGYSPSDADKEKVVMADSAVTVNHVACYTDTDGTIGQNPSLAINGGGFQAGLSGTAGTLTSFPSTASKGSLVIQAIDNTGDTVTTIRNAQMGQASTVSIPDPGAATANFVVAPAALVNNNLIKASGTAGKAVDAGFRIIANTTASYGGGGTSNVFSATGLTASAKGSAVIRTSTNAVAIAKALPGTDNLTITFTADPGASTTVDYIYSTAAV